MLIDGEISLELRTVVPCPQVGTNGEGWWSRSVELMLAGRGVAHIEGTDMWLMVLNIIHIHQFLRV